MSAPVFPPAFPGLRSGSQFNLMRPLLQAAPHVRAVARPVPEFTDVRVV